MAQTKEGAKKAQATMRAKYGEKYHAFYQTIGSIGGKRSRRGGFASDKVGKDGLTGRQRSVICGRMGGRKSKRGKKVWNDENYISENTNPGL